MKYLVVSYGGVGTYMMMDVIGKNNFLKIPETSGIWQKEYHHIKCPPKTFGEPVKVIYIYGDPYNALISHFRRRCILKEWARNHCKNMHGEWWKLNTDWELLDYLKNGEDLFKFEEHFDNWVNIKDKDYDVMVLKYEFVKKYENVVLSYLDSENPINYKERLSNWNDLDSDSFELLKNYVWKIL